MTGYPFTPRGGNFLPPGGKWRASTIGSSFLSGGLTIVGNVKPTPRKDTVIFRANWVKILKEGIYRVMDEDKYLNTTAASPARPYRALVPSA